MVVVETQQIPSSGAPTSDCPYRVFLSFRGADTRYTFTDHLYRALEGAGLRTFRDDDEIDKGEKIDSELKKAISESQSSIIVFSKNYASSRWCLDELVMIMNRARTYGSKYVVLPVFYHLDPAHVRHQIGSYGEAFAKHESKFKDSEGSTERISSWKGALREAAYLSGMDLKSQLERGSDTRYTFADHLYTALDGAGIRTFRDDDEMEKGKRIHSEIKSAINASQSSVIVFSKDFASSRWCLEEVVMIMNRAKTYGPKYLVLPVFYHVNPAHVRHQIGSFGEAFAAHESKFRDGRRASAEEWTKRVSRWRDALRQAADLSGMDLKCQAEGYEAKFIRKIVAVIQDKVKYKTLSLPSHLTGIDNKVREINCWLRDGSKNVSFMAICGIGGIGKTTIARHAFNLNHNSFESSCFLSNVRETFKKPDGLIHLQRQVISDISNRKNTEIYSSDEGFNKTKDILWGKRVLLVLDDIDGEEQLHGLLGLRDFFGEGSKIMITTRNRDLRKAHDPTDYEIHDVKTMDDFESLLLFSRHAFGKDEPDEAFLDISKRIIQQCVGLPLALRVLGSSLLQRKDIRVWEDTLVKLQASHETTILQTLRISYDALQDDHDKKLFLEISCFFAGEDKDYMITILNSSDFHARIGLENLIDRCLLEVDEFNKLVMHQMIRDMGREICRLEGPDDPGKRRRLWRHSDSFKVLEENTGTKTIEALVLDMRQQNEKYLKTDAFRRMQKLRMLHINYSDGLTGSYKKFPKNIRWFRWDGCPLTSIPNDFPLEACAAIEIRHGGLTLGLTQKKVFTFLKILDLSSSKGLTRILDFSRFPMLERLILKECVNLIEVDESIGNLENSLIFLDLGYCTSLLELPRNIDMLNVLETLIVSGCTNLVEFPENMAKMKALKSCKASGVVMNQDDSSSSTALPIVLAKPRTGPILPWATSPCSLVNLELWGCGLSDNSFPRSFSNIPMLQYLELGNNLFRFLPECIKGLTVLKRISFNLCEKLESLIGLPEVSELDLLNCVSLRKVTYQAGAGLKTDTFILGCRELIFLEHTFQLMPIMSIGTYLIDAFNFVDWKSMGSMDITFFYTSTFTTRKGPIQGLKEACGILSLYFPGNKVPALASWFSHGNRGATLSRLFNQVTFYTTLKLSLIVPYSASNMYAVTLCFVFSTSAEMWCGVDNVICVRVVNESKHVKLMFIPTWHGYKEESCEDMTWIVSNWILGDDKLEPEDELEIFLYGNPLIPYHVKVKNISCRIRGIENSQQVVAQTKQHTVTEDGTYMYGNSHIFK